METVRIAGHDAIIGGTFEGLHWACVTLPRYGTARVPAPFAVTIDYDGWLWHSAEVPVYHHPLSPPGEPQRKSPGAFIHHYFVQVV